MTYSDEDPVEITLGICESCDNYVPFVRLVTGKDDRVYQCLTCKARHTQHAISYTHLTLPTILLV